ncbi:enoyl-CoA hydratase [Pseudomaricurvus alkylphenolicus]|uniref:enoyl-CoA hydratase-related protein n=1 Tax=Pseudomaricurvus alkylphenolicus TaxID=1306991 RepID=UPI0014232368|nr:enoyl-CoA hydratase-related protein [Pseudomaricurvus alkylphenolicus]NIB43573.1 enoyl-CoA hydratase [Pseudomaricurvus alkylphenolicus]
MSESVEQAAPRLTDASLKVEGAVATLTFERDDVRNAITGTALVEDLLAVAEWVNVEKSISVLVITGAGKGFSAGGNVKDMANRGGDFAGDVEEVADRYRQGIQRMPLAMEKIEVPVIAAVNGAAIGAGFDLANMCDIRLASERAKFGETFVNLGIIPGDGGAWFMQRLIGYQRAAELTFTGRVISAEEALQYGVVLEVLPAEELLPRAQQLAREIASKPPHAVRLSKRLMKMAQRQQLPDFLDVCAAFQGICHNNPDHLKAVEAMLAAMGGSKS